MPSKVFSKNDYFKMLEESLKSPQPKLPNLAEKIRQIARRNVGPRTKES